MSTLRANTLQDASGSNSVPMATVASGTAKAWVNLNGTTSPGTIRSSFNVSSVTRVSTGVYTVNFSNALTDGNYATVILAKVTDTSTQANNFLMAGSYTQTSTSCPFVLGRPGDAQVDAAIISVAIFR